MPAVSPAQGSEYQALKQVQCLESQACFWANEIVCTSGCASDDKGVTCPYFWQETKASSGAQSQHTKAQTGAMIQIT